MPIADLIYAGGQLMLLGMGIVFGFLILLVFVLKLMSRLAQLIESRDSETVGLASVTQPAPVEPVPMAVIAAAIARYRASRAR